MVNRFLLRNSSMKEGFTELKRCDLFLFGLKVASLKKEKDSLMQKLQQEAPSDVQRARGLQRENAQVCLGCHCTLDKFCFAPRKCSQKQT